MLICKVLILLYILFVQWEPHTAEASVSGCGSVFEGSKPSVSSHGIRPKDHFKVTIIRSEPKVSNGHQQVDVLTERGETFLDVSCVSHVESMDLQLTDNRPEVMSKEVEVIDDARAYHQKKVLPELWGVLHKIFAERRKLGDSKVEELKKQDFLEVPTYRTTRILIHHMGKLIGYLQVYNGRNKGSEENHVGIFSLEIGAGRRSEVLPVLNISPPNGAYFFLPMERASMKFDGLGNSFFLRHRQSERPDIIEVGRLLTLGDARSRMLSSFVFGWQMRSIIKNPDQTTVVAYTDQVGAKLFGMKWGFETEEVHRAPQESDGKTHDLYFLSTPGKDLLNRMDDLNSASGVQFDKGNIDGTTTEQ